MTSNLQKKFNFISVLIIFSLCFYIPLGALAQTVDPSVSQLRAQSAAISAQGTAEQNGPTTSASNSAAKSAATALGGCSIGILAGQILASALVGIVSAVSGLVKKQVASTATGVVTGKADSIANLAVPTVIVGVAEQHLISLDIASAHLNQKSISASASQGGWDGIVSAITDIFSTPSLDAIGFCIANQMIAYIANSTITWINTGFKGSPVFVSNTGQFFKGIEDQELGNFVNGVAGGTLGINLCAPFKVAVLVDTLGGVSRPNPLSCSLSKIKTNYKQFTSGGWNSGGIPGWFELIQQPNNVYGATIMAKDQAYIAISQKQNTATIDLNWAKGYRNFTTCADKSSADKDGKCANGMPAVTTTLGGYVENQVNARGAAGMNRLNIATSFDQVVSALVNELVKIAVNKVFDTSSTPSYNYSQAIAGNNNPSYLASSVPTVNCSANNSQIDTNNPQANITWTGVASGGSGNYTYSWSGDASGSNPTVTNIYTTTGIRNSTLTVTDTSSGHSSSASCSSNVYGPITSSCSGSVTTGKTTDDMNAKIAYLNTQQAIIAAGGTSNTDNINTVTWYANVSGGSGNYTYSWSGDASGSGQSIIDAYNTTGTKNGKITIYDNSSTAISTATCSMNI